MSWRKIRAGLAGRPTRREPDEPTAAVALVLTPALEILLILRAQRRGDHWSGQMALPGGRRERSDADPLATSRRETLEETGIDLSAAEFLGELDDLAPRNPLLPPVIVRPYVFGVAQKTPLKASDEVAGHLWVSLESLKAAEGSVEVDFGGQTRTVQAYLTGIKPVWGMTHRILSGFLERIS
jgi:8-oxo-dGTP pyrophosphatase MutT (NUDIX family)